MVLGLDLDRRSSDERNEQSSSRASDTAVVVGGVEMRKREPSTFDLLLPMIPRTHGVFEANLFVLRSDV